MALRLPRFLTRWLRPRPCAEERRLLDRCHGDPELARRLIEHELARHPKASRARAAASALERWNRDR